jgi:hypothetical protein
MRPLTASKIIPGKKQELLDVHSLFDLPNRSDKDYMDYLATVSEDLDQRGMEWPILVVKKDNYWNRFPWQDDSKMGVVTGSNRYRYALDKGYTHIEGIICDNRSIWLELWYNTFYRVKSGLTDSQ